MSPQINTKIEGIFTPNTVPMFASGEINEPELRRYINWLIERGVHGLYPNGSTGEFTRYTADERRRIVQIVCDEARGRVPVLAGAAEANVRETIRTCETYLEYGARAVAIVAPYYFKLGDEAVYAYFAEIARNVPIDVTLYNIPMFASPMNVDTICRLSKFSRIVGIKDSSGDISFMQRIMGAILPSRPDFVFLTGWEAALAPMLMIGCNGGTNASSGVVPEVTRKIFDLVKSNRLREACQLQFQLITLFDALLAQKEFPEGFRRGAELRGFNMGLGRQPLGLTSQIDRNYLQSLIEKVLASAEIIKTT